MRVTDGSADGLPQDGDDAVNVVLAGAAGLPHEAVDVPETEEGFPQGDALPVDGLDDAGELGLPHELPLKNPLPDGLPKPVLPPPI
jgi:hypothetical protein